MIFVRRFPPEKEENFQSKIKLFQRGNPDTRRSADVTQTKIVYCDAVSQPK